MRRFYPINLLFILLGAAVAIFWVYLTGGREFLAGLVQLPNGILLALPALTALWLFIRFIRWQYLLRRLGIRVPIRPSLAIYLASLPGTATPAYVGELVRGLFMRRAFGVPVRITAAVLVVERLFDIVALGVILAIAADVFWLRQLTWLLLAAIGLFALTGEPMALRLGASTAVLKQTGRMIIWIRLLALSLGTWLPATLLITFAAASLNLFVPPLVGMRVFSAATLLGAATLMPAGIGATGSLAILQLQGIGFSIADAVVVVSLVRLMSTGLALSAGTVFFLQQLRALRKAAVKENVNHFDSIAREYDEQFSSHIWNHLLDRRIGLIANSLPHPPSTAGIGLDMGCGLGRQILEMTQRGYRVVGIDPAYQLLEQGRKAGAVAAAGNALALPFGDASFDFVYVVGVLHHLPGVDAQAGACREVARVLKPGGLFVVHESNPRNLLFRFYMGYLFPILKSIDEGTEWWIDSQHWENAAGLELCEVHYFTFLPDFLPRTLMRFATRMERLLETSALRPYSVHYAAVLHKAAAATIPVPSRAVSALVTAAVDNR